MGERGSHYSYLLVDQLKLPRPESVVEELSVIKAVVIRTIRLCVIRRCQHRHLVSVDGVVTEKVLHLFRNLYRYAIEQTSLNAGYQRISELLFSASSAPHHGVII